MFALFISLFNCSPSFAGPNKYRSSGFLQSSLGLRLGWSGGPNGLSYRRVFAPSQAFEFVAGYNMKEGRTLDIPTYRKGNTFAEFRYAPFTMKYGNNVGVGFNLDLGARLRYHNYRKFKSSYSAEAKKITPEMILGGGMLIEVNDRVQFFGDMHVRYYNRISNAWAWAMESGAGIRFVLGS